MPQLTIYPTTDDLPPLVACQIHAFIRIFWYDGFQYDLNAKVTTPLWHATHFVMGDQQVVYSHAATVWRMTEHAGETYKTYGLNAVLTYPAFRNRGYGRQVVDAATAHIDRDPDADFGLLFTDPELAGFYAQSGWEHLPGLQVLSGQPEQPELYDVFSMVKFISPKAKQARSRFEEEPYYFGEYTW